MNETPTFPYDVAFSSLATDVALAEALARDLSPTMLTFVYSREKETLLGGDGMDRFASVFGGFDHGLPAEVLLREPEPFLKSLNEETLKRFETLFELVNATLPS